MNVITDVMRSSTWTCTSVKVGGILVMTVILMTHWTMASTQTLAHTPSVSAGMREPYSHYCIHSWSLDSQADANLNMQGRI
jgi:hypothetical protein